MDMDSPGSPSFETWSKGTSRYLCALCDDLLLGEINFRCHLEQAHATFWDRYVSDYGNPRFEASHVTCQLCNRKVVLDNLKLQLHMAKYHDNMDLRLYYDNYVKSKAGEEKESSMNLDDNGNVDKESVGTSNVIVNVKSDAADMTEKQVTDHDGDETHHDSDIDSIEGKKSKSNWDRFEEWTGACKYQCILCKDGVEMSQSADLKEHLNSKHEDQMKNRSIRGTIRSSTDLETFTRLTI